VTFGERSGMTYSGVTTDTYVGSLTSGNNHGGEQVWHVSGDGSGEVGLLKFDVSAIPPTAKVLFAQVVVNTVGGSSDYGAGNYIQIFKVLESWTEGNLLNTAGVANWTTRNTSQAWTTTGCGAPGSRDPTVLAQFVADTLDTEWWTDLPPSLVQGWVSNPPTNFGMAFFLTDLADYGYFASSENTTTSVRPMLVVTYVP
jgi:hypothetical protein